MKKPYISRVVIKNFRNFKDVDIELGRNMVIIGENNVGKTNFIRALQLILDPKLTEEDRMLDEKDFYCGINSPIKNGESITISIFISDFNEDMTFLSQFSDSKVIENKKEYCKITYEYKAMDGKYTYIIYKGNETYNSFTYQDRKYLNIRVIEALRDVEHEIRNQRLSPINKMMSDYEFDEEVLEKITEKYRESRIRCFKFG